MGQIGQEVAKCVQFEGNRIPDTCPNCRPFSITKWATYRWRFFFPIPDILPYILPDVLSDALELSRPKPGQKPQKKPDNVVKWWDSQTDYPNLRQMTFDFLPIPAMSTQCERVFSDNKHG